MVFKMITKDPNNNKLKLKIKPTINKEKKKNYKKN
jgi:hypothetical protein